MRENTRLAFRAFGCFYLASTEDASSTVRFSDAISVWVQVTFGIDDHVCLPVYLYGDGDVGGSNNNRQAG